ncbi:MAG: CHASE2 domain-containing protein, partial [Nitrospiraceae bacterium]
MLAPRVRSTTALASLIALLAVLAAWGVRFLAPSTFSALDWAAYDIWVQHRTAPPASPSLVLITRDEAGEARFGTEMWDHALFARVITALGRAGATVVGLDVPIGGTSPPGRGGAASDAMLIEASRSTGRVVYPLNIRLATDVKRPVSGLPHPSWPTMPRTTLKRFSEAAWIGAPRPALVQHAAGMGHAMIPADKDGVVRRAPLYVRLEDRAVPAFGMALLAASLKVAPEQVSIRGQAVHLHEARFPDGTMRRLSIPIDEQGRMLISYIGRESTPAFASTSFLDVWRAIERGEPDKIRDWVAGKIVVLLPGEHSAGSRQTPFEEGVSDSFIQLNVLNTLLTEAWTREASPMVSVFAALILAGSAAWLFLSVSGAMGLAAVVALALGYIGAVAAALSMSSLVIPLWFPLFSLALASGGTTLWTHLTTGHRVRLLESHIEGVQQELVVAREALICRESIVEGLEEDLEATRIAVARSAGKEQELVRSAEALRAHLG